jgi:GntR family transcriptional regulator, transcriptional repressor for pyruvate dehydrogenase complex
LEIRHGSGVYVRGDLTRLIMMNPHQSPLAAETVVELLEAREVLEPPLAEAATRSATDDQLAALTAALGQAETALGSDVALHAANVEFHRAIGRSSGNAVLAQVICSLMDIYGQEQRAILNLYGDRVRDYHAHRAILAAMRARQPLRARRLMSEHLRDVRTVVTRALARKGSSNQT